MSRIVENEYSLFPPSQKRFASTTTNNSLSLPRRVKGWPTPILNQEDVEAYLVPLYSQGWSITFRSGKTKSRESYAIPMLQTFYEGTSWDAIRALGTLVRKLEESENHHVEVQPLGFEQPPPSDEPLELSEIKPPTRVALRVHTHSAILPLSETSGKEVDDRDSRHVSGLTLRDVRFAMLLDEFVNEHNAQDSDPASELVKGLSPVSPTPSTLRELLPGRVAAKTAE